jgi:tetratricopeptide (TPR) repeat protein
MPPPSSPSKKSPYFKSQLSRAAALESDLSEAKSEQQASRLRIQLCEVLSDVILSNPELSLRKDCFGRLWRACFYARIGELRSRISREKRKKQSKTALDNLESTLKTFLKEGVALYKYLVEQYEVKLLPSESQDETEPLPATEGVVAGLHRILIYLGDLYRYACSYPKAQECYEQAAKLAPSKGNPYNQMAVVAQLKQPDQPLSCVALYYYARSLLATHDPFPTSKGNLERLLEQNRTWLQTTSEQELLEQQTTTYAQRVEPTKAKRAVASRLFLARLVDVHYDFFTQTKMEERLTRDAELVEKMNILLRKLEALLTDWAFGDSLLVKMVAIHAFSIEWTQSKTLARAFMLKFGALLAERLECSLKKALEKRSTSLRLLMPLVLLNDYVSTWNHDADSPDKAVSFQARDFCVSARSRYWTSVASVATQLLPLRNTLGLDEMDVDTLSLPEYGNLKGFKPFDSIVNAGTTSDDVYVSPDDAVLLLQLESSQPAASLQPAEANTLKLKRFFDTIDFMVEKKLPICCVNGHYRVFSLKVGDVDEIVDSDDDAQMMEEDDPIVDLDDTQEERVIKPLSKPKTPISFVKEAPKPRTPLSLHENTAARVSVHQETENVLEYKPSEGGAGPALLVPGALLLNKTQENSPQSAATSVLRVAAPPVVSTERQLLNSTPTITNPMQPQQFVLQSSLAPPIPQDVTMGESSPALHVTVTTEQPHVGPPPGLLPPPGFGVGPSATNLFGTTTSTSQPPPMAFGYAGVYPPSSNQNLPDGDTVLQMLRGISTTTANPFMTTSSVDSNVDNLFASHLSSNDDSMDGMSLLDSSLLNSMMMDNDGTSKHQSRNPFLT